MKGNERRKLILEDLKDSNKSLKGSFLAKKYNVSRQVIVQDIALLRAKGAQIISTSEGYLIYDNNNNKKKRVFLVMHKNEEIEDELNLIVDLGGTVTNVFVSHDMYGEIRADMMIDSRRAVKQFVKKISDKEIVPLMNLTKGEHYHTVEAQSEKILDLIEKELEEKGYLINNS